MPFLDLPDHTRLFYTDENPPAQPAVILLHGLGADSSSWLFQTPALAAAGLRVIAVDTPGFGRSDRPPQAGSIASLAGFIPELLTQLKLRSAHLVGISMGGTLALQTALDYADRVDSLVLVNTFARLDIYNPRVWPYYLARFILVHTPGLEAQANTVAIRIFPGEQQEQHRRMLVRQILQVDPAYYRLTLRSLARFNVTSRLAQIHHPTLVITGEQDTTVPPTIQTRMAQAMPAARQVIIPQAGHAASVDQPDRFNQLLIDFLLASTPAPSADYTEKVSI